jgi:hypothetical protein
MNDNTFNDNGIGFDSNAYNPNNQQFYQQNEFYSEQPQ